MPKEITFKISPDGMDCVVEGDGFIGQECTLFSKKILKSLGVVEEEKKKDEYYKREHQQHSH